MNSEEVTIMGDKKDNLLLNEQALSEDELNEVTAGFSFSTLFDFIGSIFKIRSVKDIIPVSAGLTRPDPNG
jgi:hypothetical protein